MNTLKFVGRVLIFYALNIFLGKESIITTMFLMVYQRTTKIKNHCGLEQQTMAEGRGAGTLLVTPGQTAVFLSKQGRDPEAKQGAGRGEWG